MYSDMRMLAGRTIMEGMGPMQKPRWATGMVKVRPEQLLLPWCWSTETQFLGEVLAIAL